MKGIQSKSLRVPSTLRMLRLVNSEVCERGKECCGYNLEKKKPSLLHKPTHRPFGLSICSACLPVVSASIGCKSRLKDVSERVERYDDLKLAFETHFDNITGEDCGPWVLYKNVTQIQNTVWEEEKRKAMFDDLFQQLDSTIPEEDKVRSEAYITAFNSAMAESHAHQLRKLNTFRAKEQAKLDKRVARKKELSEPVFDKLEKLLEDFKYKDGAMSGYWNEFGFYSFDCWPSKVALEPLLSAPSSATKKKMKLAVELLRRIYSTLVSMGFNGDPYQTILRLESFNLREDLANHERSLLNLFMYENSFIGFMHVNNKNNCRNIWNSLQAGKVPEALFWSLESYEDKMNAFVYSVVTDDKTEKLAQTIWKRNNYSGGVPVNGLYGSHREYFPHTFNFYRESYNACKIDFDRIVLLVKEYMEYPATAAWLARTTPNPFNAGQTFSRMVSFLFLVFWYCNTDFNSLLEIAALEHSLIFLTETISKKISLFICFYTMAK